MEASPASTNPSSRTFRILRRIKKGLVLLALLVAVWLLTSYAVAYRLTSRRHPRCAPPAPPASWGHVDSLRLTTHDGEQLGAWFVPGRERLPVVLLLHGNGGCRRKCARQAELLQSLGHPVLLISFRAHEDSTGEVNDFGYSGRHDVVAAVDWLEQNQPGRPILVWGQSAGAAAALFAAEELGSHVHGYILECPYRDLHTAVRNRTRMYLPPLVDALGAQGLFLIAPLVLPHADSISPLKAAARVPTSTPVLLLAGGKDRHALPEEAQDIQQCLGARARLVVFEGADHVKLLQADPERYRDCVTCFLEEITAGVPGR